MGAASASRSRSAINAPSAMIVTITRRSCASASARPANAMDRAKFEAIVASALRSIPRDFREAMQNIAIVVEDEPPRALLREMEIDPPDTLFGLYQGTPLTERRWDYGNVLPDRILLFQGPHEREA